MNPPDELDEELRDHIERQTAWYSGQGLSLEEARRRALIDFGGVTQTREDCRRAPFESLLRDLRYGVRMLRRNPGFTAVAVLSLALGIGVNSAIFSLVNAVLFESIPVKHPEELVSPIIRFPRGWRSNVEFDLFAELRRSQRSFSQVFASIPVEMNFRMGDFTARVLTHRVSGNYGAALGLSPFLGRTLTDKDDHNAVAMLSYLFWRRHFAGDPAVVGQTISLNQVPTTIVGILPPRFFGFDPASAPDLLLPLGNCRSQVWLMGRLKPGVTVAQATAETDAASMRVLGKHGGALPADQTAFWRLRYHYGSPLVILMGLAVVVLLVACANVATLLLSRSHARAAEIGLRLAIGASRGRLIRQLLTESGLLMVCGASLGTFFAYYAHRLFRALLMDVRTGEMLAFHLDARMLAFTVAISGATTIVFGLVPALRATRPEVVRGSRFRLRLSKTPVIAQVAASLVLVTGAGLFARTLHNLYKLDPGFLAENLLLMRLDASPVPAYPGEVQRRVAALPGVLSAALAGNMVFGGGWNKTVWIEGHPPGEEVSVDFNLVGPGFFATNGVPVLRGREFRPQDRPGSPNVALVNEAFVRRYWPGRDPIGSRISDRPHHVCEVIGVVRNSKSFSLREAVKPAIYQALLQEPEPTRVMSLHVRTRGNPLLLTAGIRQVINGIDKNAAVYDVRTLTQDVDESLRGERMIAATSGFFGLLGLGLNAIGIYGLIAYAVARRTGEIGVRIALGASRGALLWMITRETLAMVMAGVALGLPATLLATRSLRSVLFGLSAGDPLTYTAAAVLMLAVGAAAAWLPARRAAALDPVAALRCE